VPNAKAIQNCTELHLASRGITNLSGFSAFEDLSTLWLNNNALTRLSGLEHNPRVQRLYVQENRLLSLKGMEAFTFLSTLCCYNNEISDLHATIAVLQDYRHLTELDMHGNPLCEETNYRLHVIKVRTEGARAKRARGEGAAAVSALLRQKRAESRAGGHASEASKKKKALLLLLLLSAAAAAAAAAALRSHEEEGAAAAAALRLHEEEGAAADSALPRQKRAESGTVGGRPPEPPLLPARWPIRSAHMLGRTCTLTPPSAGEIRTCARPPPTPSAPSLSSPLHFSPLL
jgi:hypothetical protein